MQPFTSKFIAIVSLLVLGTGIQAASAGGITHIVHTDGTTRDYRDVSIRLIDHRGIRITSADRRGSLMVSKGACAYAGEVMRCLPYRVVLEQAGAKRPIDFVRGTEYVNFTPTVQSLSRSSMHVPPHGVLLMLVTARGTYITVSGTFDGMSR